VEREPVEQRSLKRLILRIMRPSRLVRLQACPGRPKRFQFLCGFTDPAESPKILQ
jgi:hypothetical protein